MNSGSCSIGGMGTDVEDVSDPEQVDRNARGSSYVGCIRSRYNFAEIS